MKAHDIRRRTRGAAPLNRTKNCWTPMTFGCGAGGRGAGGRGAGGSAGRSAGGRGAARGIPLCPQPLSDGKYEIARGKLSGMRQRRDKREVARHLTGLYGIERCPFQAVGEID